jgi:hypothetical protein
MITIEQVEEFLWKFFGENHFVTPDACANCRLTKGVFTIQDLGPDLADFLHERGVDIDWSDGSRFGKHTSRDAPTSMITDATAMDDITNLMSVYEWSTDTLDDIATVVRLTGRKIRDMEDEDETTEAEPG